MRRRRYRARRTIGVLAAAAAVLVAAACGGGDSGSEPEVASTPATGTPIKIGNVGLYSGSFGAQYQRGADALVAWSKWVNEHGGINGHPVEVIVRDDQGDPTKSITAVRELVERDKVVAIVGPIAGATDAAWRSYVEEHRIPVIGGLTTTLQYGSSPMYFPASSDAVGFLTSQLNAVKLTGKKKFGVIVCAEQASCQEAIPLLERLATELGLEMVGAQTAAASAPNFTAQCAALRSAGAEVLLPETAGPTITRIMRDCTTQNYKPTYVFPGGVFDEEDHIQPVAEGAWVVSGAPLWFGDQPNHADFEAALEKYTENEPDGFASRSWQAGLLFQAAAERATGDEITSEQILEGLYALDGDTLGGWSVPLRFTEGEPSSIGACDWYIQIKDGKLTAPKGFEPVCVEN